MKIFILEDQPTRIEWFVTAFADHRVVVANDAGLAMQILSNSKFDIIFLDHDLEGKENVSSLDTNCGMRVAAFLATQKEKTRVVVHSWNKAGVKSMIDVLKAADYKVEWKPFGDFNKKILYN